MTTLAEKRVAQNVMIEDLFEKGLTVNGVYWCLQNAFGDAAYSLGTVRHLARRFHEREKPGVVVVSDDDDENGGAILGPGIVTTSLLGITTAFPKEWVRSEDYLEEVLQPGSSEYIKIESTFTSTIREKRGAVIVEIRRIQNPILYAQYTVHLMTVKNRMTPGCTLPVMRWLWHGTSETLAEEITRNGFSRSLCGKNGHPYGRGNHFYCDPEMVAGTAQDLPNGNGERHVILCQVLTGVYCQGNRDTKVPSVRSKEAATPCESTVDNMADPRVFVTYHDAQAYPAYVIKFVLCS